MARAIHPPGDDQKTDDSVTTTDRNMNSLRSSLTLSLNSLAVPLPSMENVQEGGSILFENFVREQFHIQGVEEPSIDNFLDERDAGDSPLINGAGSSVRVTPTATFYPPDAAAAAASTPEGYKTTNWTKIGRDMREIADRLADSREGAEIRRQAEQVHLTDITEDSFIKLMVELFSEGFTIERVVSLFYFCSNLIIRAAQRNNSGLTKFLFAWSLRFILNKVCKWVHENGGWEKVISQMYNVILKVCFVSIMIIGIGCGIAYIRKNW